MKLVATKRFELDMDIPPVQNTTLPFSRSGLKVSVESLIGTGEGLMLVILVGVLYRAN